MMTKSQKIKSFLYFLCLIVSALLYLATTTDEKEHPIEKNTISAEDHIQKGGLSNTTSTAY